MTKQIDILDTLPYALMWIKKPPYLRSFLSGVEQGNTDLAGYGHVWFDNQLTYQQIDPLWATMADGFQCLKEQNKLSVDARNLFDMLLAMSRTAASIVNTGAEVEVYKNHLLYRGMPDDVSLLSVLWQGDWKIHQASVVYFGVEKHQWTDLAYLTAKEIESLAALPPIQTKP